MHYSILHKIKDLTKYPINVIHNGVDTNLFSPASKETVYSKYGINLSRKILLGVASFWETRKGLDEFIKLSELVSDEFQIVLVGVDDKTRKRLPKNIYSIERTNNINELAEIYSHAYLFINPTFEDNYPTTILEAVSCGTPVISYSTGGSAELIPSKLAKLVKERNPVNLIEAIRNFNAYSDIKKDCREFAVKNLDKSISLIKYIEILKEYKHE